MLAEGENPESLSSAGLILRAPATAAKSTGEPRALAAGWRPTVFNPRLQATSLAAGSTDGIARLFDPLTGTCIVLHVDRGF